MLTESRIHSLLSLGALAALAAMGALWGPAAQAAWAAPLLYAAFVAAYQYDVRIPGLGSMNVDQAVAIPAVAILQNPVLAGVVAGAAILSTRLYRRGLRGIRSLHAFDACNVALSVTLGGWVYLALTRGDPRGSWVWAIHLLAGMAATSAVNLALFALERAIVGKPLPSATLLGYARTGTLWLFLSAPFAGLVVHSLRTGDVVGVSLGALIVLFAVWALRLSAGLEAKNLALTEAQGKQAFLQKLALSSAGSLEDEPQFKELLEGLKESVGWDRAMLLMNLPGEPGETYLVASGAPSPQESTARDALFAFLEEPTLMHRPRITQGEEVEWLLDPDARSQLVILLATTEMAFGALVAERTSATPFREEEAAYLKTALTQTARLIQDAVLKRQLLETNRKLLQRNEHLSQILRISNLLRIHFEPQEILAQVARGIREGLGFQTVLISLHLPEEKCFQRIAQAGLDTLWDEIREKRPPEDYFLNSMLDRFKVGNCYLIRHDENTPGEFDIIPEAPDTPLGPGDWHPEDMLLVPLYGRDENLLGIISVDEPVDGKVPPEENLRALEVLANQTVTALEGAQIHARTRRQATLDGLTGLYNHGFFQEALASGARELARGGMPYAVLMMDLDNFKEINDTHGHIAGDAVLKAVASSLATSTRREDVAARYGGEEFALFLPGKDSSSSLSIAERIRKVVGELRVSVEEGKAPLRVTISVGLASYPADGEDHHRILERADAALYEAKREGKNRVHASGARG